jgi:enamine deaminase RidA (YjgF/YER057c/UK114 family)
VSASTLSTLDQAVANKGASMRNTALAISALLLTAPLFAQSGAPAGAPPRPAAAPNTSEVNFYGSPNAAISSGVVIPAGRAFVWTSGTTPSVAKADAPAGSRERFGDTRTQATSILKTLADQLGRQGLSMKDVVYLRAYLVPDPTKGNKIDMDGWSAAYGEVFGTAANPTKPARSTVGVAALVNADWLIEIEAFAVFPAK